MIDRKINCYLLIVYIFLHLIGDSIRLRPSAEDVSA